ncbi:MAG: heme-binding protein [Pigmentiphaga sp.]|nr:heme-binding protein [Pigmentiphaga sp.]
MEMKPVLTAEDVQKVLHAADAHARTQQWGVSIAVVDEGGHLLSFTRRDGASAFTADIAIAKARTAAIAKRETKVFEGIVNNGRPAFLSIGVDGLLEGGVPLVYEGYVVGAVGVSGVRSDQDAEVANAGAQVLANA